MSSILQRLAGALHRSTHTQRCWDLTQAIPSQDLELIITAAVSAPVKQNYAYFHLHVLEDRHKIQSVYECSHGFGLPDSSLPGGMRIIKNTQTLANCVLIFEAYNTGENLHRNLERAQGVDRSLRHDQTRAVSMAAAYANLTAHLLGYRTGFCECFNPLEVKQHLGLTDMPQLMLGIGFPDKTRHRTKHHLDNTITYPSHDRETIPVSRYTKEDSQ